MLGIVHDDCPSLQRRTGQGSIPQVDANRFRLGHVLARRNSCWCSQCPLPGRPFLRRGREQKVCRASECYFSFALGPVLGCPLQGKVVTAATCCSGDASGGLGRLHCPEWSPCSAPSVLHTAGHLLVVHVSWPLRACRLDWTLLHTYIRPAAAGGGAAAVNEPHASCRQRARLDSDSERNLN